MPRPALARSPGAAGPLLALDWQDAAACASVDPELFFPDDGITMAPAKRVCRGCGVRAECLELALENGDGHGVFGGLGPWERARLARPARPAPLAPAPVPSAIPDLTPAEVARFGLALAPGDHGATWAGPVNRKGHGVFTIRRGGLARPVRAHRLAWKLATGTDPAGLVVRQECGQPLCCAPACLTAAARKALAA